MYLIQIFFLLKLVQSITILDCKCGISQGSSASLRIYGGVEATENQYPWIVYIEFNLDNYCSGVLINNLYILTSAHCVHKGMNLNFKLYVNNLNRLSSKPIKLRPKEIIPHKDYKMESTKNTINDLALIKIESPVQFNEKIYPICLPHPQSDHSKRTANILGWGLREDGKPSSILKEAKVQVMSKNYCEKSMIAKYYNHKSMICAFNNSGDACQGDSGGPLFFKNSENQQELIGLISWGIKCGMQLPGIYTRVTYFIDWIEENTEDAGYCNV